MASVTELGYLGIGVKRTDEWRSYAEGILGIPASAPDKDGTTFLRMDGNHHRFALHEDGQDDILYVGLQVDDAAALDEIAGRVSDSGVAVTAGGRADAGQRRVGGLVRFTDPEGLAVELFYDAEPGATPFAAVKAGAAFVTGNMGMGHAVFAVNDLQSTMDFYTNILGMKVSDYIHMGPVTLGFLHCNPRHHTLAFAQTPGARKRTNHFMVQLDDINTVGRTYDAVQAGAAPLMSTLGQHSNDQMVSFYMANPSGFGVEYGWGGIEVDDACWQVAEYDSPSTWGHRFSRPPAPPA